MSAPLPLDTVVAIAKRHIAYGQLEPFLAELRGLAASAAPRDEPAYGVWRAPFFEGDLEHTCTRQGYQGYGSEDSCKACEALYARWSREWKTVRPVGRPWEELVSAARVVLSVLTRADLANDSLIWFEERQLLFQALARLDEALPAPPVSAMEPPKETR